MPRKNAFHEIVKVALVKDGWQITDDPFLIGFRDTLPDGDVQPPGDQHWGQRELHIRMPDGHWLAFGQPIQR